MKNLRDCIKAWSMAESEPEREQIIQEALELSKDRELKPMTAAERDNFFLDFMHQLNESETAFIMGVIDYLARPATRA